MSQKKLEVIDTTVQKTYEWLGEIREELHVEDSQTAYHALSSVLHTLRDRLGPEEVAGLGAQFPILVRGIFYDAWHPANKPLKMRSKQEFLNLVHERFGAIAMIQPERLVHSVLAVVERHISAGEVEKIQATLPKGIRELWPKAA
jgi:uncharacterized protein (DUF2267 family)